LGLKIAIFQILKAVQGQDQDRLAKIKTKTSKNGLKTKTGLKDYITGLHYFTAFPFKAFGIHFSW